MVIIRLGDNFKNRSKKKGHILSLAKVLEKPEIKIVNTYFLTAMKTTALIFFLTFGFSAPALAQKSNIGIVPDGINKNLQSQPNIDFRNHLFLGKLDTLRRDSIEVHFPKEFLLERELNMSNLKSMKPNETSLPFFELPPSQSRMPIILFDESVNYTILKKEFK